MQKNIHLLNSVNIGAYIIPSNKVEIERNNLFTVMTMHAHAKVGTELLLIFKILVQQLP